MILKFRVFLFCILTATATASPVQLVLTESGNFAEIFEAGLRPVRQAGMSNSMCIVKDVEIQLITNGVIHPVIQAQTVRVRVLENHLLSSVEIISSEMLTKSQAIALADKWGADLADADTFLRDGWLIGVKNDNWKAGAGFKKTYVEEKPYRFGIAVQWKRPMNQMSVHRGLLPPPPGFENVPMDANEELLDDSSENFPKYRENRDAPKEEKSGTESIDRSNGLNWIIASLIFTIMIAIFFSCSHWISSKNKSNP